MNSDPGHTKVIPVQSADVMLQCTCLGQTYGAEGHMVIQGIGCQKWTLSTSFLQVISS